MSVNLAGLLTNPSVTKPSESGSNCFNHNFYWYEDPVEQKFHLIPWDMDVSFENINGNNPVTHIADEWGEEKADCKAFNHGPFNIFPENNNLKEIWNAQHSRVQSENVNILN